MNKTLIAVSIALAIGTAALPSGVQATPAASTYSTADTDIGTLLDTPVTRAILDKYMPGFSTNEQVSMARSMTLRTVQQFAPDKIKTEVLDQIDAAFKTLRQ